MLAVTFLSAAKTTSPGLAVPDASTTSLVLPEDGGLNGAGPDELPARSHGFGGEGPERYKPLAVEHVTHCVCGPHKLTRNSLI